jgi:hypothetical protein
MYALNNDEHTYEGRSLYSINWLYIGISETTITA